MYALFQTLSEISLGVTVVILLLVAVRPFFARRYNAKWRCAVWLVLALRLLIPFKLTLPQTQMPVVTVPLPQKVVYTMPQQNSSQTNVQIPAADTGAPQVNADRLAQSAQQQAKPQSAQPLSQITLTDLLIWGWATGALVFMASGLFHYAVAKRKLFSTAVPAPSAQEVCDALTKKEGTHPISVYEVRSFSGPMLVGLVRPCIVLPKGGWTQQEIAMILRHELLHAKRHDIAFKLLLCAVCWLHWWNPAVWLLRRAAQEDIELACDEAVVQGEDRAFRAAYGESIVSTLRHGGKLLGSTSFAGGKRTIKARITGVFDMRKKRRGVVALSLTLALCIAAGTFVACRTDTPVSAAPPLVTVQQEDLPEQAWQLVNWYESDAMGNDWPTEQTTYLPAQTFAIGYLFNGKGSKYLSQFLINGGGSDGYYAIPQAIAEQCSEMVLGITQDIPDGFSEMTLSQDYQLTQSVHLELTAMTTQPDGTMICDFSRSYQGIQSMRPVSYTFQKAILETVPGYFAADYAPGDEIWQLVRVENKPFVDTKIPETIEINTAQELADFARSYNADGWRYRGNVYLLTADIDLAGVDFVPIGQSDTIMNSWDERDASVAGFNAVFDGQGHTIRNLSVGDTQMNTGLGTGNYRGFFSYIGRNGVVKNLNIENARIDANGHDATPTGILAGGCEGHVENCTVSGIVKGTTATGGMFGQLTGWASRYGTDHGNVTVSNCVADTEVSGYHSVGGFAGIANNAKIDNCTAKGTVIGNDTDSKAYSFTNFPHWVGGFVGSDYSDSYENCTTDIRLVINGSGGYIGYFIGGAWESSAVNCTYNAAQLGNWQLIDCISDQDATPQAMQPYELKPLV